MNLLYQRTLFRPDQFHSRTSCTTTSFPWSRLDKAAREDDYPQLKHVFQHYYLKKLLLEEKQFAELD